MFECRDRLHVGYIRINQPISHIEQYECAAWYENRVSKTGVFNLFLETGVDGGRPVKRLAAEIPSTVESNYFQSLSNGNPIGKAYDTEQDKGKDAQPIKVTFDCVAGIEKHGNIPCKDVTTEPVSCFSADWLRHQDVYFQPEVWQEILDWAQGRFDDVCIDLRGYLADLEIGHFVASKKDDWTPRMVAHCGREADKWHKVVESITRQMGYRGLNGKHPLCDITPNLTWVPGQ